MAERNIRIRNFRNVGIEKKEDLLLNSSVEKGEMGNLIVVVGPNNSGKSNCLDAIMAVGNVNGLSSTDTPDFINDNPKPELSIIISNDDVTLGYNKSLNNYKKEIESYFYASSNTKINQRMETTINATKQSRDLAVALIRFNIQNGQINRVPKQYHQSAQNVTNTQKFNDDYEMVNKIHQVNSSIWGINYVRQYLNLQYDDTKVQELLSEFNPTTPNIPQEVIEWEEQHQLKVVPKIVRFKETIASHNQLMVTPDQLPSSPFFQSLFSAIDYNIDELINCYKKAKEQNLYGLFKKTTKDINDKLDMISNQFNKLFFQKDKKYTFEITLEIEKVYLSIFIDDIVLHLDKQSAGFRWFFNFYFSVIAQTQLQRGDIIIMDEPATNLHMQGVQELRSFMKDYAKKSELTIVVSTHLPFFVDVDYLDEVRIVNRIGDGACIENKFHAIGGQETDSLKPIKDALTVGRNVLYDQSKTHTIFVEGITDYCYLTAFKVLFKTENIVFLPIQGLKKKDIVKTLQKIEKLPTILVDGDKTGEDFKKEYENSKNVEIISLSEIDNTWTTIESLFSEEDKRKTKFFNDSVSFKNRLNHNRVSKETKSNFKKLLDYIAI